MTSGDRAYPSVIVRYKQRTDQGRDGSALVHAQVEEACEEVKKGPQCRVRRVRMVLTRPGLEQDRNISDVRLYPFDFRCLLSGRRLTTMFSKPDESALTTISSANGRPRLQRDAYLEVRAWYKSMSGMRHIGEERQESSD